MPLAEIQRQLRNEFLGTDQVLERFLDNATFMGSQVFLRAFLIVKRDGARQIMKDNCVDEFSDYARAKIEAYGGDTVSTEAVASRRHAGGQPSATGWKLELPTTTWHLLLN